MRDVLLELGQRPYARKVIKSLGLPVPMPQALRRAEGPLSARPLEGRVVVVGGGGADASLAPAIARATAGAGARVYVSEDQGARAAYREVIERGDAAVWDSSAREGAREGAREDAREDLRPDAVVFDASSIGAASDLRALYDFFHPLMSALAPRGRAIVVGRPPEEAQAAEEAAARAALEGFVRSASRELGRRGATANLIYAGSGAEERAAGPLGFLLSDRAAFITGQPLRVGARGGAGFAHQAERALEGRIALVTGAARGIGAKTAERLAEEGARVVCLDRPEDEEHTAAVAGRCGGAVLSADIRDAGAPARIAGELEGEFGGVDIVIHNAGITRDKTLARMSEAAWDEVMGVNLRAPLAITAELAERELLRRGGRVVCLSSVAGLSGNMGQTNYAASKAGIVGFVRKEAEILSDRGIAVNAIAPGFIETRLTRAMPTMVREAARRLSSLGQGGEPRDVAEAAIFLSSPASAGLTGAVVRVCGGAFVGA